MLIACSSIELGCNTYELLSSHSFYARPDFDRGWEGVRPFPNGSVEKGLGTFTK